MRWRFAWGSAWTLGAAALLPLDGCVAPGAHRIVGPDGSPMAHVHCGSDQGACFRLAGELCPNGYDFRPVLSGNDGNFLVRCHTAAAPTAPIARPASTSAVAAQPPAIVTRPPQANAAEIDLGY